MFDHPHISKPKMEELVLTFYDEEYKRLGPSVIRFIEKQFKGYLRFKNASDPLLRKRAEQNKQGCIEGLPLFPTAIKNAPSEEVAQRIRNSYQSIVAEIGTGGLKNKVLAGMVPALTAMEKFKLKNLPYSQPKLRRTEYRMSESWLHQVALRGEGVLTIKPRPQNADQRTLVLDLDGAFDRITAMKLKKRIESYLQTSTGNLAINFSGLTTIDRDILFLFFERLLGYKERIKIISIDSLRAEMADVVNYAKNYFEVIMDVESLTTESA
mgnify:FL=1